MAAPKPSKPCKAPFRDTFSSRQDRQYTSTATQNPVHTHIMARQPQRLMIHAPTVGPMTTEPLEISMYMAKPWAIFWGGNSVRI